MPIQAGIGSSRHRDPKEAVEEAYKKANASFRRKPVTIALLFASPTKYNQEKLLECIREKLPEAMIAGCSTSGEITNYGSKDRSIALALIHSESKRFILGLGEGIREDARQAGRDCAKNILNQSNGKKPKAVIMLPDGLAGNGADIVRGMLDVLGKNTKLAGGAAGDDFLFKETYQYLDTKVYTNSVVAIGIFGDVKIGIGVRHGWIPVGNPRTVTKAESNIVYELDNEPAIKIYEDQFGKRRTAANLDEPFARLAITYPLGVTIPGKDEYLIRDPISVDKTGAITCAAEIPEGSKVYTMIGSPDEAIAAAKEAARKSIQQTDKKASLVLLFNCIARKKLLMNKRQNEIDGIISIIGKKTPLVGFYTYGEQAPLSDEVGTCSFHNETDVIVSID